MLGKEYQVKGNFSGYYLEKASQEQKNVVSEMFEQRIKTRYSEIIFKPDLKVTFAGKEKSIFGALDSYLSNNVGFLSSVARQCSYHAYKS